MPNDNQVRVRIDPNLLAPLAEVAASQGMDVQELMRTVTRHLIVTGPDYSLTAPIGGEVKEVQTIIDAEIASLYRSGSCKKGRDARLWIQEKIEDARARVFEGRGTAQRYFVLVKDRELGPHRLDKLREWFALKILSGDTQVRGAKSGTTCAIKTIPNFKDYPPVLKRKLEDLKRESRPYWWNLAPTEAQARRLQFFDLPYVKEGLTRGRASMLITHFAFLDPKKEELYQAADER